MQRPVHVKDKSGAKYEGCLCEYCENISLKVQAINKLQPGTFRNEYDLAACTMCEKPSGEKFFRPQCIQRKCRKCGIAKLDEKLQGIMSQRNKVIWQGWEIVTTMYHGEKRFQKNQKEKTYSERGQCNHACKGTQRGSNFRWTFIQQGLAKCTREDANPEPSTARGARSLWFCAELQMWTSEGSSKCLLCTGLGDSAPNILYYQCPECKEPTRNRNWHGQRQEKSEIMLRIYGCKAWTHTRDENIDTLDMYTMHHYKWPTCLLVWIQRKRTLKSLSFSGNCGMRSSKTLLGIKPIALTPLDGSQMSTLRTGRQLLRYLGKKLWAKHTPASFISTKVSKSMPQRQRIQTNSDTWVTLFWKHRQKKSTWNITGSLKCSVRAVIWIHGWNVGMKGGNILGF